MGLTKAYDLIVVGTGHAGVEAALAGARMGLSTACFTTNLDNVAMMNCNPSIGGPAKGHLVKEIDALGGEMAFATDQTFLQMRMLNTGKGPAVQALRAQVDKREYAWYMRMALEQTPNLDLKQGMVQDIVVEDGRVVGITTATGLFFGAKAIVLSTGTYLHGKTIVGEVHRQSGPSGMAPSVGLTANLRRLGFEVGRYKTGTPPRIDGRTIDRSQMERQDGDGRPWRFSSLSVGNDREQLPCWLSHTTARTHAVIRSNLHRAPLYNGSIESRGPRYCPSVEDKMVRFADKESHQIFLEPETRSSIELYMLGFSTSLPEEVQIEAIRTIPGMEEAELLRSGYAIEYDYLISTQLKGSLETKKVSGLFCGGQINGTSGYEEAAAQGLMAGINAALYVQNRPALVLGRSEAYIGVLIDDLVTKSSGEPYRIMTSRAEYRLMLRQGNAALRLTEHGRSVGLVSGDRWATYSAFRDSMSNELVRLESTIVAPNDQVQSVLRMKGTSELKSGSTAAQLLRRPQITYSDLVGMGYGDAALAPGVAEEVQVQLKYAGYIEQEVALVERVKRLDARRIASGFDYAGLRGLSIEAREKLLAIQPETIGQASRILGVTPADIAVLMIYVEQDRAVKRGE